MIWRLRARNAVFSLRTSSRFCQGVGVENTAVYVCGMEEKENTHLEQASKQDKVGINGRGCIIAEAVRFVNGLRVTFDLEIWISVRTAER